MTGAVVTLSGLEKQFGGVGAVRGVSLEVSSGEFLTLLGPSGSGKTTTLMMVAGFETPTAGDIAIDGRSVVGVSPHRRNIGMVFQNYALFPHLTVADNIGFPLKQRGVNKADRARAVGQALELVHLPGYGGRYPRQLSGGQQQRVALARAIVFRPRLLLMDEPLGALDKQLRESMQLEMRRLHGELGITFVYVTHDQEEALTMSDRIAVMNEGRIAQLGRPEELYDRPCNRFVASFIGESNFLPGIVHGFHGEDIVVAACGGTMVRAVAPSRPERGAQVVLTMRPERMRFFDGDGVGSAALNRLQATVTDAVFAGERAAICCRRRMARRWCLRNRPVPRSGAARWGKSRRLPGRRGYCRCLRALTVSAIASASRPRAVRLPWKHTVPVLLVAPLLIFMLVCYVEPVLAMLLRSVSDPTWSLHNYG